MIDKMAGQWSNRKRSDSTGPEVVYTPLENPEAKPESNGSYVKAAVYVCVTLVTCTLALLALSQTASLIHDEIQPDKQVNIVNVNKVSKVYIDHSSRSGNANPESIDVSVDDVVVSMKQVGQDFNVRHLPLSQQPHVAEPQCTIEDTSRFDCWPEYVGATEEDCEARGCCWEPATTEGAPYCYFPSNYDGYTASNVQSTDSGITADLTRTTTTIFPPDITTLKLQIDYQTESTLRVKLFDPSDARFEPPVDVPQGSTAVSNPLYQVNVTTSPFNLVITRASTGATVFDTTGMAPFIFADQFLQIGTKLSTKYLYGLGEHRNNFLQEISTWRKLVFWARDAPPSVDNNGYGSHPFFLNLEPTSSNGVGNAHGVLLLNSNAGDVALQPFETNGGITYRFTGGILDFYFILGDSPLAVASQYTNMVGLPYFPPFWSLGFHLCKYGYTDVDYLKTVIARNREANMPYDIQWNDIDYMDQYKDWTYSPDNYQGLPDVVKDIHDNNQRYIIMADPAISSSQPAGSYAPFDDGKTLDTFVKTSTGEILIGSVWPGETAFPDFFHPNAYSYWYSQAKTFHDEIPFDGLWIDMNEPSSFIDGSTQGCDETSKYMNPPFTPGTIDGGSLVSKTICPSAEHYLSAHYNLHNMYGWSQANVSRGALNTLYGNKRSPIISRSSFVGSGKFTGHWLGDNFSQWADLGYSIAGILNFNLFGIPLIGADICGFIGDTEPELCTRWHQLGAFYPFMRNHADIAAKDQDPASFDSPYVDYIRQALQLRYQLLAVLYTNFYNANTKGLPIVRPLFYVYPGTEAINYQFMWSDQLLVSPVVTQGDTSVVAFIPEDRFYDYYTGAPVDGKGTNVTLDAPIDKINVHIRGGAILPLLPETERTDDSRKEKFNIVVATSPSGKAYGELFWDDGESSDSVSASKFSFIQFNLSQTTLTTTVVASGYSAPDELQVGQFTILGVAASPSSVTVNGNAVTPQYDADNQVVTITDQTLDLLTAITVAWS